MKSLLNTSGLPDCKRETFCVQSALTKRIFHEGIEAENLAAKENVC